MFWWCLLSARKSWNENCVSCFFFPQRKTFKTFWPLNSWDFMSLLELLQLKILDKFSKGESSERFSFSQKKVSSFNFPSFVARCTFGRGNPGALNEVSTTSRRFPLTILWALKLYKTFLSSNKCVTFSFCRQNTRQMAQKTRHWIWGKINFLGLFQ